MLSPDGSGILFLAILTKGRMARKRYSVQQELAPKNNNYMKNTLSIFFIAFLFVGCQQKIKPADISKINGYWEIEKVVFDAGKDKDYGMNESYDFFKITDNKGIRKKVMPQLDGTFLVNDVYENVAVRFADDKVFLDYSTSYMKWSEELIALSEEELVLLNKDKMEYHYKKATPINLLGDGKKAE